MEINEIEKNIQKISNKSWFFEKRNKIDKSLATLINNKKEKTPTIKIKNERKGDTTKFTELKNYLGSYE